MLTPSVPAVRDGKVFLVLRGELENRFDPDMILYNRKVQDFKFPVKQVKNLIKSRPQYGSNQAGMERISNDEVRYVRITDIDEYGLLRKELGATAENIESKYILNNNDFLFARSGATVGKAFLFKKSQVEYPCIYAGYMIRFVLKENEILPEYFFAYTQLEVYKEWTKAIQRAAGQPNINAEEYKSLKIPVPSLNIQQQIVAKFETAYAAKRAKESEAARLLASIDGYLLEALGIAIPELPEKKKVFRVWSDKVSGGRLDPNAYNPERLLAIKAIEEGKFEAHKLKHLVHSAKTIVTESGNLPYIGLENIESNTGRFIEKNERDSFGSAVWFSKGQILFPKLRPYLNKVYLADFEGVCSTEFHIFDSRTAELSNEFLSIFLRSQIVVSQTKYLMSGNTLPRLQTEDIENLLIPLPPLAIQTEIATKIEVLRAQAQKLEIEAKAEVEAAKKEVEAMILGKGGSA